MNRNKTRKRVSILPFILPGLILAGTYCAISHLEETVRDRNLEMIGLADAPRAIADRHLWIIRHIPETPVDRRYIPVHVMYRRTTEDAWRLIGSGTLLTQSTNGLIASASHVFEHLKGFYGWRKICLNELTGTEPVIPILGFLPNKLPVDDAVLCMSDPHGPSVELDRQTSTNRFTEFDPDSKYQAQDYYHTLRLYDDPAGSFKGGFTTEVKPGVQYAFFPGNVEQGESGSGGWCRDEGGERFFVVIRHYFINIDPLTSALRLPNKTNYAVAYSIKFD